MADFFQSLSFWKLAPNHTALTFKNRDLVAATLAVANRATVVGYVCTTQSESEISAMTAGVRLPDGRYRILFFMPADLSVVDSRIHTSHGLREEVLIELPDFIDDLIVKIERVQERVQTIIPGTG